MNAGFFRNQLDLIYFIYGLGFIYLGIICSTSLWKQKDFIQWKWLALFGFIHGLTEWMDMLCLLFGDNTALATFRTALMALSYMFLFEFGRSNLTSVWRIPRWIIPVLFASGLTGVQWGQNGTNATIRYSLGFTGGLLAGLSLLLISKRQPAGTRKPVLFLSVFLFSYGIFSGLIAPEAQFFPASIINANSFLETFGFPVQLVRGFIAISIALLAWKYFSATIKIKALRTGTGSNLPNMTLWSATMFAVMAIGLLSVHASTMTVFDEIRQTIAKQMTIAAALLDKETPSAKQLSQIKNACRSIRALAIMEHINGKTIVLADTEGFEPAASIPPPLGELPLYNLLSLLSGSGRYRGRLS